MLFAAADALDGRHSSIASADYKNIREEKSVLACRRYSLPFSVRTEPAGFLTCTLAVRVVRYSEKTIATIAATGIKTFGKIGEVLKTTSVNDMVAKLRSLFPL